MDNILKTVGILCLCGYITGIFTDIIPMGKNEKSVRLVIVLYLIITIFDSDINFPGIDFGYEKNIIPNSPYEESYVIDKAKEKIEAQIIERLNQESICYSNIELHINKSEDGFYIDQLYLWGVDSEKLNYAKGILGDIIPAESIVSGDNNNQ
ncbi:MAG: hypothetical protein IKU54_02250 [Oscillospiraceae bacterium]|nr:hypothetical protein [Oscillospiraceae bacterium]